MIVLLHGSVHDDIGRLPSDSAAEILGALQLLATFDSFEELLSNEQLAIKRLNIDADTSPVAYREFRTPLYTHYIGSYRLVFTVTTGAAGEPSVIVLEIGRRPSEEPRR